MTIAFEATPPELLSAQARYQANLATAEERYAAALRALGRAEAAQWAEERAAGHRGRAARLRGGAR